MEARPRLLVAVALLAAAAAATVAEAGATSFNAKNYGAKGDGVTDDTKALVTAWKAACAAAGAVTLVVPAGTYHTGPLQFHGPCKASTLTFQLVARHSEGGVGPEAVRQRLDRVRVGQRAHRHRRHHRRPGRRLLAIQQVPRQKGLQSPTNQRAVREQPEHDRQGPDLSEPQVLPLRASLHQEHENERAQDQRAGDEPQHGRHPHRAQRRRLHHGHPHRHGRRLHLHRSGQRQRRGGTRPVRPGPRHERGQPGPVRRRGRRHARPRPGHDLHRHRQRGAHQDVGELTHQEQGGAHGVREPGDEGRHEPHPHRPEVLPLLQLRAQGRLRRLHQRHPVQERQGHHDHGRRRAAQVRRAVPGPRAAGRRPQVQGVRHNVGKVRERKGKVRRVPVPQAMRLVGSLNSFVFYLLVAAIGGSSLQMCEL